MRTRWLALSVTLVLAACGRSSPVPSQAAAPATDCGIPAAPAGLVASPGPGPSMASLRWDAADAAGGAPVHRYVVYRDGQPFAQLGNTLAFGDTGADASHEYAVAAINTCGVAGPRTLSVSATPLPGLLVDAPVTAAPGVAPPRLYEWPVLDAAGNEIGTRTWRVVTGLGNCCETYVATDAAGNLYEYGGTSIYISKDEGQTWSTVSNVLPNVQAEGALVGAPGGDMLGVNWDVYTGDQLFSHKYVAATGKWYTSRTPIHQPAFDRPWVAVVEGPFNIQGLIVPYISFLMSGYAHGDLMFVSYDGLNYQVPDTSLLATGIVPLKLEFPPDPDRDWNQSIQRSTVYPLDGGAGLRDTALLASSECTAAALLTETGAWTCPDWVDAMLAPQSGEIVRVDSAGALHVTTVETGSPRLSHRISRDAGRTWETLRLRLPRGLAAVEEFDVQANAALDQVVIVTHASKTADGNGQDQDVLFRITGLKDTLVLKEILLVGEGNHVFGSSLNSANDRFDYTTVALTAGGRAAMSFGDRRHVPPAIAIEVTE